MAVNMPMPVWIVDDAPSVREALGVILEAGGFRVRCYDGAAAFLADAGRGADGLLVVDHKMPGMNGIELLQQLAAGAAPPAAILISAALTPDLARQALAAGARAVMDKPVDGEELMTLLRRLSS